VVKVAVLRDLLGRHLSVRFGVGRCPGEGVVGAAGIVRWPRGSGFHINMLGRYSFQLPDLPGGLRPLRDPNAPEEA
jgi:hypothetical protein